MSRDNARLVVFFETERCLITTRMVSSPRGRRLRGFADTFIVENGGGPGNGRQRGRINHFGRTRIA